MYFRILGPISHETFAEGTGIQELERLRKVYGEGHWRKQKGIANVQLLSGELKRAEVHWYEAHGIGKKEIKLKRLIE